MSLWIVIFEFRSEVATSPWYFPFSLLIGGLRDGEDIREPSLFSSDALLCVSHEQCKCAEESSRFQSRAHAIGRRDDGALSIFIIALHIT